MSHELQFKVCCYSCGKLKPHWNCGVCRTCWKKFYAPPACVSPSETAEP